jgi:magnesium-transporting ATPase (P-type)
MIKLDWLGMKYYQVRIIVIPLGICFMGLFTEAIIIPVIALFMLSFSVNPFAVEEKGKLDNLYLTLPVTRRNIVNARLLLSLIMVFAGLIFGAAVTYVMSKLLYGKTVIMYDHDFLPDLNVMAFIICGSLLFYAIMHLSMFPVLFKIGYAKGKAIGFYAPVIVMVALVYGVGIAMMVSEAVKDRLTSAVVWMLENTALTSAIILAAAAVIYFISYILSHRMYAKREF